MSSSSGSSQNLQWHGTASQDNSQSDGFGCSCSETSLDTLASHKSRDAHVVRFKPEACNHQATSYDCCGKLPRSKSGKNQRHSIPRNKRRSSSRLSDVEILKPLCAQVLNNAQVATPSASRRGSAWTCSTRGEGSVSCDQREPRSEHQVPRTDVDQAPPSDSPERSKRLSDPYSVPTRNVTTPLPLSMPNTSSVFQYEDPNSKGPSGKQPLTPLCDKCGSEQSIRQCTNLRNTHFAAEDQQDLSSPDKCGWKLTEGNPLVDESLAILSPGRVSPRACGPSYRHPRRSVTRDEEIQSQSERCSNPSNRSSSDLQDRPADPQTTQQCTNYVPKPGQCSAAQQPENVFITPQTDDVCPASTPPAGNQPYCRPLQPNDPQMNRVSCDDHCVSRSVQTPDPFDDPERQHRGSVLPDTYSISLTSGTNTDLDDKPGRKSVRADSCWKPVVSDAYCPQQESTNPSCNYVCNDPRGYDVQDAQKAAHGSKSEQDECNGKQESSCRCSNAASGSEQPPSEKAPSILHAMRGQTSDSGQVALGTFQSPSNHLSLEQCISHHSLSGGVEVKDGTEEALNKPYSSPPLPEQYFRNKSKRAPPAPGFRDVETQDWSSSSQDKQRRSSESVNHNDATTSTHYSLADFSQNVTQRSSFSLNDPYDCLSQTGLSRVSMKERCLSPALDPSYYLNRCLQKTRARQEKSLKSMSRTLASPSPLPIEKRIPTNQPSITSVMSTKNDRQPDRSTDQQTSALTRRPSSASEERREKSENSKVSFLSDSADATPHHRTSRSPRSVSTDANHRSGTSLPQQSISIDATHLRSPRAGVPLRQTQEERSARSPSPSQQAELLQPPPRAFLKLPVFNAPSDSSAQPTSEPVSIQEAMTVPTLSRNSPHMPSERHRESPSFSSPYQPDESHDFTEMPHPQAAYSDVYGKPRRSTPYNRQESSHETPDDFPIADISSVSGSAFKKVRSHSVPSPTNQENRPPDIFFAPTFSSSSQHCILTVAISAVGSSTSPAGILPKPEANSCHCCKCRASSPVPQPDRCSASSPIPQTNQSSVIPGYCSVTPTVFPAEVASVTPAGLRIPSWSVVPSAEPVHFAPIKSFSHETLHAPQGADYSPAFGHTVNQQGLPPEYSSSAYGQSFRPRGFAVSKLEDSYSVRTYSSQVSGYDGSNQEGQYSIRGQLTDYPASRPQDVYSAHAQSPHPISYQSSEPEGPHSLYNTSQMSIYSANKPEDMFSVHGYSSQPNDNAGRKSDDVYSAHGYSSHSSNHQATKPENVYSVQRHSPQANNYQPSNPEDVYSAHGHASNHPGSNPQGPFSLHGHLSQLSSCSANNNGAAYSGQGHSPSCPLSGNQGRSPDVCATSPSTYNSAPTGPDQHTHCLRPLDCAVHAPPVSNGLNSINSAQAGCGNHHGSPIVFLTNTQTHGRECQPSPSFDQYPLYPLVADENYPKVAGQTSSVSLSSHHRCCAASNTNLTGFHQHSPCTSPLHDASANYTAQNTAHARACVNNQYSACETDPSQGVMAREVPSRSPGRSSARIFAQQHYLRVKRPKFPKSRTSEKPKGHPSRKCIKHQIPSSGPEEVTVLRPLQDNRELATQNLFSRYISTLKTCYNMLLLDFQKPGQQIENNVSTDKPSPSKKGSCVDAELRQPSSTSGQGKKSNEKSDVLAKTYLRLQHRRGQISKQRKPTVVKQENQNQQSCEDVHSLPSTSQASSANKTLDAPDTLCGRQAKPTESPRRIFVKGISQEAARNHEDIRLRSPFVNNPLSKMSKSHVKIDIPPKTRFARLALSAKAPRKEWNKAGTAQSQSLDSKNESKNAQFRCSGVSKRRFSTQSAGKEDAQAVRPTIAMALPNQSKGSERSFLSAFSKQASTKRTSTKTSTETLAESESVKRISASIVSRRLTAGSLKISPKRSSPSNASCVKITSCDGIHQVRCYPLEQRITSSVYSVSKEECQPSTYFKSASQMNFFQESFLAHHEKLIQEEKARHPLGAILQLSRRRYNISSKNASTQVQKISKDRRKRSLKGSKELPVITQTKSPEKSSILTHGPLRRASARGPSSEESMKSDPTCPTRNQSFANSETLDQNLIKYGGAQQANVVCEMYPASTRSCPNPENETASISASLTPSSQASAKKFTVKIRESDICDASNLKKGLVRTLTPHPCSGRDLRYSIDGELDEPERNPAADREPPPLNVISDLEGSTSKVAKLAALPTCCENNPEYLLPDKLSPETVILDGTALSKTIVKSPSSKTIESEHHIEDYVDIFAGRSKEYLSAFHAVLPSQKSNHLSVLKIPAHREFSAPTTSYSDAPYHLAPIISYPTESVAGTETRRRSSCSNIPASISPNDPAEFKSTQTDCSCSRQTSTSTGTDQTIGTCGHQYHRTFHGFQPLFSPSCPSHSGVFMLWSQPNHDMPNLLPPTTACWDCGRSHCHHFDFNHHHDTGLTSTKDDTKKCNIPELRDSTTSPHSFSTNITTGNVNKAVRKKRILRKIGNKRL